MFARYKLLLQLLEYWDIISMKGSLVDRMLTKLIHRLLSIPLIFDLQEFICNEYDSVRKEFIEYLSKDGLKVLDIGCGTGISAKNIVDMERQSYTGIELMPEYAALAAKRNPKGRVLVMDATKMTFPARSFDVEFFLGVWHHMDDQVVQNSLKNAKRVLRPGGVVLVAEPLFTPGHWYSTMMLKRDRGDYIRSRDSYLALTKGWRVVRERTFQFPPHRYLSLVLRPRS